MYNSKTFLDSRIREVLSFSSKTVKNLLQEVLPFFSRQF